MRARRWWIAGALAVAAIALAGWIAIELGRDPLVPAVFSGP